MRFKVWRTGKDVTAWDFLGTSGPAPPRTPAQRALTARMQEAFGQQARELSEEHATTEAGDPGPPCYCGRPQPEHTDDELLDCMGRKTAEVHRGIYGPGSG
jgi:hypothetical protein